MHDGKQALPGARECFAALAKSKKKKLVVLSNTSRRRDHALSKLPKIGFDAALLSGFVCSGELAWQHMVDQCGGQRCLWISWSDDFMAWQADYLDGTNVCLATAAEADFVLLHGSQCLRDGQQGSQASAATGLWEGDGVPSQALMEALATCAERGLPMLCANPDLFVTLPDGSRGRMPGLIAESYEQLGGVVIYYGKPHRPAFDAALAMLSKELPALDPARVLHVGDSLAHDVRGASAAGIHSLFVASGIHAEEIGIEEGDQNAVLSEEGLESLFAKHGAQPTYSTLAFRW